MADEKDDLLRYLSYQRKHVLAALLGLSEDQLRRSVFPSGWHGLGMVKHLALDVEHYWFRCITAGESLDFFKMGTEEEIEAWKIGPDESAESVGSLYRAEIERANVIISATPLDAPPAQADPQLGGSQMPNLRSTVLHVIAETACHAGHLDAARELIDGHQHLVL